MARAEFQSPPGTRDVTDPEASRARHLVALFAEQARTAGFERIIPPMFEDVGVFVRLGEASDVVSKELYAFEDKGGRTIALRPEFTASVCRAYVQHRPLTPWKTFYEGPAFRYDKPQKGRYRQFDQVGVEVIGSSDPDIDTEVISVAWKFLAGLGLTGHTLIINSLGDFAERPAYLTALTDYFRSRAGELSDQANATLSINPLRVLDSKRAGDAAVASEAPTILEYLSAESAAAFERVQAGLDALGVPYVVDPRLVRGLDYYTRTTFEFVSDSLDAAQNALGGGGRYDGLIEALGGPAEPGVGFSIGVDRTLLACDAEGVFAAPAHAVDVWVVATTAGVEGLALVEELRAAGIAADRTYDGRSMKAQMKAANRSQAPIAVIVGEDEVSAGTVSVRTMRTASTTESENTSEETESEPQQQGHQFQVDRSKLIETVRSLLP